MNFSSILVVAAALVGGLPATPSAKTAVIIDTDIGSDVDDAFAIALAMTSPELDVRGITTSGGQAIDRAWIVCRLLTHGGLAKTPVAAGADPQPDYGIDWQIQYRRHPAPIFNRTQKPEKKPAAEWIHDQLARGDSKITILALGPLTNIARLLQDHAGDRARIERIVWSGAVNKDPAAARDVLNSGVPLAVTSLGAANPVRLEKGDRNRLFSAYTPLTLQIQTLYELWDRETPTLHDAVAVTAAINDRFLKWADVHIGVDDSEKIITNDGQANGKVAAAIDLAALRTWAIDRIRAAGTTSLPKVAGNLSTLVERGAFPAKVHVAEDYDTDIEKRWWMTGKEETRDVPPGGRRANRGVLTQDFDDRQGNMTTSYRAVVFNPVPGPPMGKNTRLTFRYKLIGTDHLRVQLYSLTNGYHRYLSVKGLPTNEWREATVDMTHMRRPDGTGGPLSENERIDDIQFYVDPRAEVLIDDVILYDVAATGESRPFPRRILYTGWFDTGKHGKEWVGGFAIVSHDPPRQWKAARSVTRKTDGGPGSQWIRIDLKGERRLDATVAATFQYHLVGAKQITAELHHTRSGRSWTNTLKDLTSDRWSEATADFAIDSLPASVDEIRLIVPDGATLTIDNLLLYVPGTKP